MEMPDTVFEAFDTPWPKVNRNEVERYAVEAFAMGIVGQAVTDWRRLLKKIPKKRLCMTEVKKRKCMLNEIRHFLNGKWCETLMYDDDARTNMISILEKEYQNSEFLKQARRIEDGTLC